LCLVRKSPAEKFLIYSLISFAGQNRIRNLNEEAFSGLHKLHMLHLLDNQCVNKNMQNGGEVANLAEFIFGCELQSCKTELESSKVELDARKEEIVKCNQEIESYKEEIRTSKSAYQSMKESQAQTTAQIDSIKNTFEKVNAETKAACDRTIEDKNSLIGYKNQEISRLNDELSKLHLENHEKKQKIRNLEEKLKMFSNQY
jgi:predicted RNase H-like nuclease (RuvC/YqgF family)